MPDWYYNWNVEWLDWWRDHPFVFWGAVAGIIALELLSYRFRRR